MRIEKLFIDICRKYPKRVAAIHNEKEITYQELLDNACKVSDYIEDYINMKNQNIGIIFNNQIEFIYSMFGILISGNIVVPIPHNSTENEINIIIYNCDVKLCVADENIKHCIKNIECITWDECYAHINKMSNKSIDCFGVSNEVAFIFSTSGSTGNCKAVQLTHENIIESATGHSIALGINENDRFLATMPFHTSHGVANVIVACIMSLTIIVIYRVPIIPKKMSSTINKYKITIFSSVPTYMALFIKYQNGNNDFPSVKTVIISGAKLYENLYNEIKDVFNNADILHTYGLTEASPRVSMMTRDSNILSCGKPVRGVEMRIINEDGELAITDEIGEIQVKGKNVMKGYYENDVLTNNTVVHGWLHTGDIGKIDKYGNLHVISRKKNVIINSGQNIYPEEIEEKLLSCDNVKEALVFGFPDEIYGEIVLAILSVYDKKTFLNIDKFKFEKEVPLYKKPKGYLFVDNLPKTATDKIDRKKSKEKGIELYQIKCKFNN